MTERGLRPFLAWAILALPLAASSNDVPDWLSEAAARAVPAYPEKTATVALLREETMTVEPEGRQTMVERGAVKILQRTRQSPTAYRTYNMKSGRIPEFQGWLLPASGKPTVFGRNAIFDVSLSTKYEYEEARAKVLSPGDDLAPGSVFAWEITEEEKTNFTQYEWDFRDGGDPVLVSRFSITMPAGWEIRGTVLNREGVQPRVDGNTWTWELDNLPWIEPEEHAPGMHASAPRLGLSYYPAANARPDLKPLASWSAVSDWTSALMDPAATATDAIRAKAAELTSGATTELDRIRAIGAFVQKTNYVAVELNLARGGGYTPHAAGDVLARNYGDCKDKATLMRALLKAIGITAWPVTIYSGDPQYVRAEWPSPQQFNHVIVAIQVSAKTSAPVVLEYPRLGRLLIFDPTDPDVPVGDLPEHEQGSRALIVAGASGDLVTMPQLGPEANRIESECTGSLAADGQLSSHFDRRYFGQPGAFLRELAAKEHDALKREYEEILARRLGGLTLDRIEATDHADRDLVQLNMDVTVKRFGHTLQNRLLVISPGAVGLRARYAFPAKPRNFPVRLLAEDHHDSVSISVPAEFKVDEMPAPVHIDSAYGAYSASWKADGNKVLFQQKLEVKAVTAPASDYPAIRDFFEKVAGAQNSSVVLVRD